VINEVHIAVLAIQNCLSKGLEFSVMPQMASGTAMIKGRVSMSGGIRDKMKGYLNKSGGIMGNRNISEGFLALQVASGKTKKKQDGTEQVI
jgi:hypothetical protein